MEKFLRKQKFFKYAISGLLIVICLSTASDAQCTAKLGCADCFSWCGASKYLCNQRLVQAYCRQTCNLCPSTAPACTALNCTQRCILSDDRSTASCACFDGYELDADGRTCNDIDECDRNGPTLCQNSTGGSYCRNIEGDYACVSCQALGNSNIWSYYNRNECCTRNIGEECGKSSTTGRIVGGKNSKIRRWPWTAYVKNGDNLCGGSLVTRNHIVTAGYCVHDRELNSLRVLLGVEDTTEGSSVHVQTRSVVKVHIHPDYDFPKNDIAIIELDRPVIDSSYVSTICLPNGEDPQPGEMCYAVGYGATRVGGEAADALQEVNLPIIDGKVCEKAFSNDTNKINSTSQFCAGYFKGGRDTCQGDGGGAIMCQRCNSCDWYLAGVTSYGIRCATPKLFGVYSRVTFFEEWITGITNQSYSPQACRKTSWHQWGPWTKCSVSCGVGTKSRIRLCMNGLVGDPGCIGSTSEIGSCNAAPCNNTRSSHWSECSTTCGNGTRNRTRNGQTETETCNIRSFCPTWSEFEEWSDCSVTCGGGIRTSSRRCLNGSIGEMGCLGSSQRQEACNTQCCPSWSEFSPFSSCSVTCGGGIMTSNRICRCGVAGDVGCEGNETRKSACATEECPQFSQWTEFNSCSAQCNGGMRIRTRTCSKPNLCVPDEHGVAIEETETCNTQPCMATWGPFGEYGNCSMTCGGGTQSRSRNCVSGLVGTGNCIGSATEERSCNTMTCTENSRSNCSQLTNARDEAICCEFAQQGYCTTIYQEFMTQNCAKTCCEYTPGHPCNIETCSNVLSEDTCNLFKSSCSHPYIQSHCRATCNLC